MCAIAGIVRFDRPASQSRDGVARMLRRMKHRGPDDSHVVVNSHAAIGNARLSLLDRAGGQQPMTSPDGRWHLTYNGEVYNWRELRAELFGRWSFQTECDTEVVLASLAVWGEQAVQRFNGMFALFLWDDLTQSGIGARDRLGVKPLVFLHEQQTFAFASEAKALLEILGAVPQANQEAVLEYLVAPCFSGVEQPMFERLRHLLPGQLLRVSQSGIELRTWWDWQLPSEWSMDADSLADELSSRIQRGVARTLSLDHSVGAFLSGGLDSTLLASLASRISPGVKTFAIQFEEQAGFDYGRSLIVRSDDTPFAEAAAREIGVKHCTISVPRKNLGRDLRELAEINDTLPAWEQELAQYHLARAAASEGLRCVLVGDAADETHYGYSFVLDAEATGSPERILRRFAAPGLRSAVRQQSAFEHFDRHYRALAQNAGHNWDTPLSRLLATTYLLIKRWLPRLLQNGDFHTMAFSIEARVPFADSEVLDVSRVTHPTLALSGGQEKRILRQAARGLMPEVSRVRPKSSLPKDQRSAAIYQREASRALEESMDFIGAWLDVPAIQGLCDPSRELDERERALLFRVVSLHHWRQHYSVRAP